jgi:hypothetical protein
MPLKNVRVLNLEIPAVERVALCPDSASTSPRVAYSGLGLYISHPMDASTSYAPRTRASPKFPIRRLLLGGSREAHQ